MRSRKREASLQRSIRARKADGRRATPTCDGQQHDVVALSGTHNGVTSPVQTEIIRPSVHSKGPRRFTEMLTSSRCSVRGPASLSDLSPAVRVYLTDPRAERSGGTAASHRTPRADSAARCCCPPCTGSRCGEPTGARSGRAKPSPSCFPLGRGPAGDDRPNRRLAHRQTADAVRRQGSLTTALRHFLQPEKLRVTASPIYSDLNRTPFVICITRSSVGYRSRLAAASAAPISGARDRRLTFYGVRMSFPQSGTVSASTASRRFRLERLRPRSWRVSALFLVHRDAVVFT
jgi:hypothetical protein